MTRTQSLFVAPLSCLALLSGAPLSGQGPAFEAVSIKVNRSGESRSQFRGTLSGISVTNQTVLDVIRNVWNVNRLQIVGGPSWAGEDRFDIEARASGKAGRDELVAMMKTMLADRFKLALHPETRPIPVYALVLARSDGRFGPTLRQSLAKCDTRNPPAPGTPPPQPPPPLDGVDLPSCGTNTGRGMLRAAGIQLEAFTRNMAGVAGRIIVDKTGLTGTYDMVLRFNPDANDTSSDLPSLFAAVQEQLGLKLDAQTAPAEVLVIDRVERPTEN
jgi:uncharacterized protein (TIGR03435 family)